MFNFIIFFCIVKILNKSGWLLRFFQIFPLLKTFLCLQCNGIFNLGTSFLISLGFGLEGWSTRSKEGREFIVVRTIEGGRIVVIQLDLDWTYYHTPALVLDAKPPFASKTNIPMQTMNTLLYKRRRLFTVSCWVLSPVPYFTSDPFRHLRYSLFLTPFPFRLLIFPPILLSSYPLYSVSIHSFLFLSVQPFMFSMRLLIM